MGETKDLPIPGRAPGAAGWHVTRQRGAERVQEPLLILDRVPTDHPQEEAEHPPGIPDTPVALGKIYSAHIQSDLCDSHR